MSRNLQPPRGGGSAEGCRLRELGRGGLRRALQYPPRSRQLGASVLAIWLVVHVLVIVRAAVPTAGLGRGPYPWHMFAQASMNEVSFHAEARAPNGPWVDLPVARVFRYARGATNLRVYDQARQLFAAGHEAERQRFAQFLATRLADWLPPGATEMRLRFHMRHVATGEVHDSQLGTFSIQPPAPAPVSKRP